MKQFVLRYAILVIWGFGGFELGKKSFKVELSLSAQINNGKSIKVESKKYFYGWFGRNSNSSKVSMSS